MRTYILDILPRIVNFSKKLDNLSLLQNQNWVLVKEINEVKTSFNFLSQGRLLISRSGEIEEAQWEYINESSISIRASFGYYLLRKNFFDENIMALGKDGDKKNNLVFVNENKTKDRQINTLEDVSTFLYKKYIRPKEIKKVQEDKKARINRLWNLYLSLGFGLLLACFGLVFLIMGSIAIIDDLQRYLKVTSESYKSELLFDNLIPMSLVLAFFSFIVLFVSFRLLRYYFRNR